ncbi:MAG TPA: septum formation initiator family protein [Caldilineaceae bacterium]|nr:septum formation initiator family protein [Caldilineaceae bacterium]
MATPKRDTRLLLTVVLGVCLLFAITYAGRLARQAALTREVARWEQKNIESVKRQHALEAELRYIQSDAYIEELAHDELGMVKPDEELVVIVPAQQAAVTTTLPEDEETETKPFWHNWLARLGW